MTKFEINIVDEIDVVHTFEMDVTKNSFMFQNKRYKIDKDAIYYYPKKDTFTPTLFYEKGKPNPIVFSYKNESIPARALNLLWNHTLYRVLVQMDKDKTNLIVILLLLISMGFYGLRLFLEGGF